MRNVIESKSRDSVLDYFGTLPSPVTFDDWLASVTAAVASGRRHCLWGHHNLHSLYSLRRNRVVRAFYARCDDCYIDGMAAGLVLAGAGLPIGRIHRFSLMDTFPELLDYAQRSEWTVFYLGSSEAVVGIARQRISREFPRLNIHLHQGFLGDDHLLVETINKIAPDLLLVGMGMPLQESWLLRHIDTLDVAVATHAGATLDYFAGAQAKPPLWISNIGLAWLYRLLHDPGRLWRRYLVEPWSLVLPTLRLWFTA